MPTRRGHIKTRDAMVIAKPIIKLCLLKIFALSLWGGICDDNCVLFLWTTYPMLKEAMRVMESWGFTYKTIAFQWVKLNPLSRSPFYGLGRWTRGNTEPCLLATKGKPKRVSNSVFQLIHTPIQRHSQKPKEAREKIIKLMGDLPRIELFAREKTAGWDAWGNEIESDIELGNVGEYARGMKR